MGGCFAFWYDELGGIIGGRSCWSCGLDGWNERRFNLYQTIHYFAEEDQWQMGSRDRVCSLVFVVCSLVCSLVFKVEKQRILQSA